MAKIEKKDWISQFTLVGELKLSDYTFNLQKHSENNEHWVYNSANIGVFCGEKHGTVFGEMMGGYSDNGNSVIYAHGKNEDGSDNWNDQIKIDWDNRKDPDVMDTVGERCFITVGLEKTSEGKNFYKKFLSAYDAVEYIQSVASNGMVVNVKGKLQYSMYKGEVQVKKVITSIALSKAEPDKFGAAFVQSILIDKDSFDSKNADKEKSVVPIDCKVLDYCKEIDGQEIKSQYPYSYCFELQVDFEKPEMCKYYATKLFKVKKGYTQITFKGEFIESGAAVTATMDDVPDDVKALIAAGIYTEEEALKKCSANGKSEKRMVLTKPDFKQVDGAVVLQVFEERYTDDDFVFDIPEATKEEKKPEISLDDFDLKDLFGE